MVSLSDSLPLLFSTKLLTDARLSRNLPTQQYDLRQSVTAYAKPTGDQKRVSCIMATWLTLSLWEQMSTLSPVQSVSVSLPRHAWWWLPTISTNCRKKNSFNFDTVMNIWCMLSHWSSLACHPVMDDDVQSAWQIISNLYRSLSSISGVMGGWGTTSKGWMQL